MSSVSSASPTARSSPRAAAGLLAHRWTLLCGIALIVALSHRLTAGIAPFALVDGLQRLALWHLAFGLTAGLLGWLAFRLLRATPDTT